MTIRERVLTSFRQHYGNPAFLVRAPGRANLIGEHTDYNDGFVLPLAVDRALYLAVAPRTDGQLCVRSLDFGDQEAIFSREQFQDASLPHWTKHVRGAWWLFAQQGRLPGGATIVMGGDIPIGAGMSSSAAIGVGMVETALRLLGDDSLSQTEKALLAVEIEHQFMGIPCGVMDQMASAAALDRSAMLLDCRSLEIQAVPLPDSVRVVVMNTMKSRELADSAYGERRQQCEEAAAILGVAALRDVHLAQVEAQQQQLGPLRYRRARHVVTENSRTLEMQQVLQRNDLAAAGRLLNASHSSLRDDYEVSVWELDTMVKLAQAQPGCYGARMMGGGFGGCAVGLVELTQVEPFLKLMQPAYAAETGRQGEFYVCSPTPGSSVESL